MTEALEGGEWSATRPVRTLPPGKSQYPFYRRLGGPQGRSGRAENLVPAGIRSRTVQPVVSRYTDWATGPTIIIQYYIIILWDNRRTCGPSFVNWNVVMRRIPVLLKKLWRTCYPWGTLGKPLSQARSLLSWIYSQVRWNHLRSMCTLITEN